MVRNARSIARWVLAVVFAGLLIQPVLAEKIKIEKMDDLPRYTYKIDMKAVELFDDEEALMKLAMDVKRDLLADLEKYEILDDNTLQGYYANLGTIAILEGDWDTYLDYLHKRRELETKEANRLTMGLLGESIAEAKKMGPENYEKNVRMLYKEKIESLPYSVVQDNLKSAKGSSEIVSKNLIFGGIEASIQPTLDESDGEMSQDIARGLLGTPFTLNYYLPLKDMVFEVLSAVIDANFVEKENIWADRDYTIEEGEGESDVILCVWDSGVDAPNFEKMNKMWKNEDEVAGNGKDDDNNGFVDDVYGIGYDLHANYEPGCLYPIGDLAKDEDLLRRQMKGLTDIQANVESEEASELKQKLSTLEQAEVQPFIEGISLYGNYCHGTHVAGITAKGNPHAKILVSRMTFDHRMIPETPTIEQAQRDAKQMRECVDYYKKNGVRAVNMSWGGSLRSIEGALEANNAGGTPEERKALAREIYTIGDTALREAIAGAPEILFITSAGNADNDVTFEEFYPSSYDYPNIMSVGAVDMAGDETSFTSLGKVDVYANGFEVMSYVPGGHEMKMNGTSMSSPQITNLAGKLFALKTDLTASQVRELIINGADDKDLGDRVIKLVNQKKSVELLKKM